MTLLPFSTPSWGRGFPATALFALLGLLLVSGCGSDPKVAKTADDTQESTPLDAGEYEGTPAPLFPLGALPDTNIWGDDFVGPVRPATPATPYVALLLPLSGEHAAVGQALLNAAQLAVFEIAGDEFVLIVRDTKGTPQGARKAARSALASGASLILGPLFATSVRPVAEEARTRGVNVIAFSNDVSVAGDGVFVMGLSPQSQVRRVIDFTSSQGIRRYAVFAPASPYGITVISALRDAVQANSVELSRVVAYNPDEADPSQQVRTLAQYDTRHEALLKERALLENKTDEDSLAQLAELETLDTIGEPDFDAVLLPVGGKSLMTLAPLLAFYDIDPVQVKFLGTAFWDDPRLSSETSLHGGWFAAPPPELWRQFRQRYRQTYSAEPVRIASLAYDASALAAVLSRTAAAAGRAPDFSGVSIAQPSGFAGMDGIFRFLPDGRIQRGLAVLEMGPNGVEVLDFAPQTFEELIN